MLLALGLVGCGSSKRLDPNLGGDVYLSFSGAIANATGAVGGTGWWATLASGTDCADEDGTPLGSYERSDLNGTSSVTFECEVLFSDHSAQNYGTLPVEYQLVIKPDGTWAATQTGQPPNSCTGQACTETPGLKAPPSHLIGRATITY
jgi:hypothetical protein